MEFLLHVAQWFVDPTNWDALAPDAWWDGSASGIPNRLFEHVLMSAAATGAAAVIALPIGVLLGHAARGAIVAMNVSNIGRAIPSFAVLVIALQLFGIGATPAFIALVALAIPPMVTNSYVGVSEVDPEVKEAARGIGMRERAVLLRVELPLAVPLIMAGIRTSTVQVVATATLAALVAWGGLGRFIVDGLSQRDFVQVFAGALMVAVLAILTELGLAWLQRLVTPRGLREQELGIGDSPLETSVAVA
jgi:osmoprotectant transport system permease protein